MILQTIKFPKFLWFQCHNWISLTDLDMVSLVVSFVLYHKWQDVNEFDRHSAMNNLRCKRGRLNSFSWVCWHYDCWYYALPNRKYVYEPLHSNYDKQNECDRRPIHKIHRNRARLVLALADHWYPNLGVLMIHYQMMNISVHASNCCYASLKCLFVDLAINDCDCDCASEMPMTMSSLYIF